MNKSFVLILLTFVNSYSVFALSKDEKMFNKFVGQSYYCNADGTVVKIDFLKDSIAKIVFYKESLAFSKINAKWKIKSKKLILKTKEKPYKVTYYNDKSLADTVLISFLIDSIPIKYHSINQGNNLYQTNSKGEIKMLKMNYYFSIKSLKCFSRIILISKSDKNRITVNMNSNYLGNIVFNNSIWEIHRFYRYFFSVYVDKNNVKHLLNTFYRKKEKMIYDNSNNEEINMID